MHVVLFQPEIPPNTGNVIRLCANTDPQRDSLFTKNPTDALDHAPTYPNLGTHLGFDATKKLPGEGYNRTWPEMVKMPTEVQARVDALRATTKA